MMMKRLLLPLAGFTLALLTFGGVALWITLTQPHTFSGVVIDPPQPAPDFELIDETGQPFALSNLRGQWILLTYGYTHCPDVCPATLAALKRARDLLGEEAANVRVVFVSVDYERDTPVILAEYVHHFSPADKGLTGTQAMMDFAASQYNVKYEVNETDEPGVYYVGHSAFVYVIDPQFRLRLTYPFGVTPQEIQSDLQIMFSQTQ
jgi:protein SCO1/2